MVRSPGADSSSRKFPPHRSKNFYLILAILNETSNSQFSVVPAFVFRVRYKVQHENSPLRREAAMKEQRKRNSTHHRTIPVLVLAFVRPATKEEGKAFRRLCDVGNFVTRTCFSKVMYELCLCDPTRLECCSNDVRYADALLQCYVLLLKHERGCFTKTRRCYSVAPGYAGLPLMPVARYTHHAMLV
jgi:hypothetical protein